MSDQLLPVKCVCGSNPQLRPAHIQDGWVSYRCPKCNAQSGFITSSNAQAIRDWNNLIASLSAEQHTVSTVTLITTPGVILSSEPLGCYTEIRVIVQTSNIKTPLKRGDGVEIRLADEAG